MGNKQVSKGVYVGDAESNVQNKLTIETNVALNSMFYVTTLAMILYAIFR